MPIDLLDRQVPAQFVLPLSAAEASSHSRHAAADAGGDGVGAETLADWWLVGLFNWSDVAAAPGGGGRLELPHLLNAAAAATSPPTPLFAPGSTASPDAGSPAAWHVFDWWSRTYHRLQGGAVAAQLSLPPVPPRCGALLAIRPVLSTRAQLVGTNIHISAGLEIGLWREGHAAGCASIELSISAGRTVVSPQLWLYLPASAGDSPPLIQVAVVSTNEHAATSQPQAAWLDAPVQAELPRIASVGEGVWVLTMAPTGPDGCSCVHRVLYSAPPSAIAPS